MSTSTQDPKSLIERLFSVGAHFGFQKSRRHPTVRPYLYGNKQGTDIFDLEKCAELIGAAKEVLEKAGEEGKTVLFVSTKEEAGGIVERIAKDAGAPYIRNRWIGGTLTNFSEIKKRITRLTTLLSEGESGELERRYTKKERVLIRRELEKLEFNFGGIKELTQLPQLLLIVDPRHDVIALREATEMNIPTIGVMSSDNDASKVTHPVVVNDALQSSITLVLEELAGAYKVGKQKFVPKTNEGGRGEYRRNLRSGA